jgi:type VI secretion system protein ImpA
MVPWCLGAFIWSGRHCAGFLTNAASGQELCEMSSSTEMQLADLSDDVPAGEDLEIDPDFTAMERAAVRKPETQYGDVITPATPPDWKEVDALASSLLGRTRDLRVLVHQAIARLNLSGPPAFAEILGQIRHQLETRWDVIHPRLDPEDDHDPTFRANTLYRLVDERNVLRPLSDLPLARSMKTGPISWRDIAVFRGQVEPEPDREKHNEAHIRDAFNNTDPERLKTLSKGIDVAVHEVDAITSAFKAAAGVDLKLDVLWKQLDGIQKELGRFEPVIAESAEEAVEPEAEPETEPVAGVAEAAPDRPVSVAVSRRPMSVRSITTLTGRDDALYLLELVASYFRANEPSNPAPLLIDRARRLATMDFMDILRDLAPDGMSQAQIVAGQLPE